jgi:Protein of unknown function (DUF973)
MSSMPPAPPAWPAAANEGLVAYSGIDRRALGDLRTFALLGIIGIVLAVVSIFATNVSSFMSFGAGSVSGAIGSAIAGAVVGIIGFVIGIVALIKVRSAFKGLSTVDRGFSTPAKLVLVFFIGLVMFILLFILLAAAFGMVITSGATSVSGLSGGFLAILGGIAVLGLVGIICFIVGAIGVIIGLWRTGGRYREDMIKIGGILYIIPVVDIAAPILVFVGVNSALRKLPPNV